MQIKIAKFQLYPREEPKGYAVGFDITTTNNRKFYIDEVVLFEDVEGFTDDEIISTVWDLLKDEIDTKVADLESRKDILTQDWIPPEKREVEDWDLVDDEELEDDDDIDT